MKREKRRKRGRKKGKKQKKRREKDKKKGRKGKQGRKGKIEMAVGEKNKIVTTFKKCSEIASKKVQNPKISYPAEGNTPSTRTPSPADFALVPIPMLFLY